MLHRRHHAGDGLPGHGRRRGGLAPADDAVLGLDADQEIIGARDGLAGHLHRLLHRQTDRDGLDRLDPHAGSPIALPSAQSPRATTRPRGLNCSGTELRDDKPHGAVRHGVDHVDRPLGAATIISGRRGMAGRALRQPLHCRGQRRAYLPFAIDGIKLQSQSRHMAERAGAVSVAPGAFQEFGGCE